MFIQKVNNHLEFFETSPQFVIGKKTSVDLGSKEDSSVVYETKDHSYLQRERLQFALVENMKQQMTREMRYAICKDIIKKMYEFRIAHFSENEVNYPVFDENGRLVNDESNPFYFNFSFNFANHTVKTLSKWVEEEFKNGGNFFDISAYSKYENRNGYYEVRSDKSSPLYINCKANNDYISSYDVPGFLEGVIYHELTHHLQNIVYHDGGWSVEHLEMHKKWEERWIEKEAVFCANYASSNRLYNHFRHPRDFKMILRSSTFDFHGYYEKMFKTNIYVTDHDGRMYFTADDLMAVKHA